MTALVSALVTAGSDSVTLSNGAELTVTIDSPLTSTEFEVPPGVATIDVPVTGSASIGLGEPDATFIYVIDTSGSTGTGGGTGCSPILDCEKEFFTQLNAAVAADGSTDEVGVINYGDTATIRDMQLAAGHQNFTLPTDPNVNTVINSLSSSGLTNCTNALQDALTLVNASSNSFNTVIFASDGFCNTGGDLTAAALALAATGAVVHSIAIGDDDQTSCTTNPAPGATGTLDEIPANGGICHRVVDPGDLPSLIDNLTGSTLQALSIKVDAGAYAPITTTSLPLPQAGAVSVTYSAVAEDLGPGDHTICVKADGTDVLGDAQSAEVCETIHLLQLSATPPTADNDLGAGDNEHTVTAHIAGDAAQVGGREVTFTVGGHNGPQTGTCNVNLDCTTDAAGNVSFTYDVPLLLSSIGTDTITVTTTIAGNASTVQVQKRWVDLQPPTIACPASVNPAGNTIPAASKSNQDGFFLLLSTDLLDPNPKIYVVDTGTGVVFGPYPSGTRIKYVQAPGVTPSAEPMTGEVDWLIKGQGDAEVYAEDIFGNKSDPVSCLVPPKPQ